MLNLGIKSQFQSLIPLESYSDQFGLAIFDYAQEVRIFTALDYDSH